MIMQRQRTVRGMAFLYDLAFYHVAFYDPAFVGDALHGHQFRYSIIYDNHRQDRQ